MRLGPCSDLVFITGLGEKYAGVEMDVLLHYCCKFNLSFVIFIFMDQGEERTASDVQANQSHGNCKLAFPQKSFNFEITLTHSCSNNSTAFQQFIKHLLCQVLICLTLEQNLSQKGGLT